MRAVCNSRNSRGRARLVALWVVRVTTVTLGIGVCHASYTLDGTPSTSGAYAYERPPATEPFGGDAGRAIVPFSEGALMDGHGDDLGASIGFPHAKDQRQVRRFFVDLLRPVIVESVTVRSRLDAWWGLSPISVELSADGRAFAHRSFIDPPWVEVPHGPALPCSAGVQPASVPDRFLRISVEVPGWRHVQIGEIDIVAHSCEASDGRVAAPTADLERVLFLQTRTPAVDHFGQWTRGEWPGKVHSTAELRARTRAEEQRYAGVRPDVRRYDRFLGRTDLGLQLPASARWRLEKVGGRWWFITPDGHPFLMVAVDAVDDLDVSIMNTVKHPAKPDIGANFEWVPRRGGPYADCWWSPSEGIDRFSFFRANLIRAFGPSNYHARFEDLARKRLIDWGFNSHGKWYWRVPGKGAALPYIRVLSPKPDEAQSLVTYNDLADSWDPGFPRAVVNAVSDQAAHIGNDPYFIGFTIGNEAWWDGDVTKAVLSSVPASPAKLAFIGRLREHFGTIDAVSRQCGSSFASFDELGGTDLSAYIEALNEPLSQFIEQSSDRYYGAWRRAVDEHDPGRLILGSSFVMGWKSCPEWIRGSAKHCDAMMLDYYGSDAARVLRDCVEAYAVPADKPVLLGEYSFTTTERGFLPYGFDCRSQAERGIAYARLNLELFAHPNWVGSMWFIYPDEVLLGRDYDGGGESHNFGLVDICNLPYYEAVRPMKEANSRLYRVHREQSP